MNIRKAAAAAAVYDRGTPFPRRMSVARCCQDRGYDHCGGMRGYPCQLLVSYSSDPVNGDHPAGADKGMPASGGERRKPMCAVRRPSRQTSRTAVITFEQSGPAGKRFVGCLFLWCGEHSDDYNRLNHGSCLTPTRRRLHSDADMGRVRHDAPLLESRFSVLLFRSTNG